MNTAATSGVSSAEKFRFDLARFHVAFANAARAAGFSDETLAATSGGPVTAWQRGVFASPENARHIYLSAGIHGDEPAGPLALLELMRCGFFSELPDVSWSVCPALNPSGLAAGSRENDAGLDLNRDYLTRTSEEVAAHIAWLSRFPGPPDLFLSLHEDWESSGFYFYEINDGDDVPHRAGKILAAAEPWFPPELASLIDGHATRAPGWIFHPPTADEPELWPEAIYISSLGCPLSFTFETPSRSPLERRIAAHVAAVRTACAE